MAELEIRPPRQERTQLAWERILDAGASLLEETGYDGFTIAAICQRAQVSPPAIYARVNGKRSLFLAVFEHGFAPVRRGQQQALDPAQWQDCSPEDLVRGAIGAVVRTSLPYAGFLRPVIWRAERDAEVAAGTREARAGIAARFRTLMLRMPEASRHPDPDRIDMCFRVVFAAVMARIAFPTVLDTGRQLSDDEFVAELQELGVGLILRPGGERARQAHRAHGRGAGSRN